MASSSSSSNSTGEMVPITREFLRETYKKYPIEPPSEELRTLRQQMEEGCAALGLDLAKLREKNGGTNDGGSSSAPTEVLEGAALEEVKRSVMTAPHKLDENCWRSRQQAEEIQHLLRDENISQLKSIISTHLKEEEQVRNWEQLVSDVKEAASSIFTCIERYQEDTRKRVEELVQTFLPQDFRASVVKYQRDRTEQRCKAEVDSLIQRGGSIKEKYDLYWKHQLERRQSLANVGNSTGAYKALIKYIGGVPQVLLDFIKTVNDAEGPMEELRIKYGPMMYFLFEFVNDANILLQLLLLLIRSSQDNETLAQRVKESLGDMTDLVRRSLTVYKTTLEEYLRLMLVIFLDSPFLITKEQADKLMGLDNLQKVVVSKDHEVQVDAKEGEIISWYFHTESKDIAFTVKHRSNTEKEVVPLKRYDAHVTAVKDTLTAVQEGKYVLRWDNSYSLFTKKTLFYKVDKVEANSEATFQQLLSSAADEEGEANTSS
ncbi:Rab-GAP TBC domain-containing protein [Balamuthia mandrillaris]